MPRPPRSPLFPYTTLFRSSALDFVRALGKEPIRAKDSSGFVVNLLLIPYMLDAINALESNVASVEDIDKGIRSEEHTSELQSHSDLVCRLLLEKKKH